MDPYKIHPTAADTNTTADSNTVEQKAASKKDRVAEQTRSSWLAHNFEIIRNPLKLPFGFGLEVASHATALQVFCILYALAFSQVVDYEIDFVSGVFAYKESTHFWKTILLSTWPRYLYAIGIALALVHEKPVLRWNVFIFVFLGLIAEMPVVYFLRDDFPTMSAVKDLVMAVAVLFAYRAIGRNLGVPHNLFASCAKVTLSCVFVMNVYGPNFGLASALRESGMSDSIRMVYILAVFPAVKELGYYIVRTAAREVYVNLEDYNTTADQSIYICYLIYVNWINRFILQKMNNKSSMLLAVVLSSLQEVMLRQTATARDRWTHVHVFRHSKDEAKALYDNEEYRSYRARVVLGEMYSEYPGIIGAGITLYLFHEQYFTYDFGYNNEFIQNQQHISKLVDVPSLIFGTIAQLVFELLCDVICLRSELNQNIPIVENWTNRYKFFNTVTFAGSILGFNMFLYSFVRFPPACTEEGRVFCECFDEIRYIVQKDFCHHWNVTNAS